MAQQGGKRADAKPLRGFSGAGVLEVITDHRGDTFRAVYTLKYADNIYVLHAFQKKSKTGRETARRDLERAVLMAMDNTIRFLLERGQKVYPLTLLARNHMLDEVEQKNLREESR